MNRIGRYEIIGELGRGAMGVVYEATDPAISRSVAIKAIRISEIRDSSERQRVRDQIFREARSAGALSHANIVTIYDVDEAAGITWIAMAHVKGPTLERTLAASPSLPLPHVLNTLSQLASALDYAHGKGVVHQDIKPANIMTDEDGALKITDFGIARLTGAIATDSGAVLGTPNYMSPEQVQGQAVDGRSDQFSLAVVAYQMLARQLPFHAERVTDLLHRIVHDTPLAPSRLVPGLSTAVDNVLSRAMSKNPIDRFPDCLSFFMALRIACGGSPGAPARAFAPEPAAISTPRRRSRATLMGVTGAALVLGLICDVAWLAAPTQDWAAAQPHEVAETALRNIDRAIDPATNAVQPADPVPAQSEDTIVVQQPSVSHPAATRPVTLQDVSVSTYPQGAKAIVDGRSTYTCDTPCTLRVPSGHHHLTVSLAGYQHEYRELNETSAAQRFAMALRKPAAALMVSSQPAGASIRINGELQTQQTPASILLPPGSYSVTVEKDGRSDTEKVDMQDRLVFLRVPLAP